ncbi:MAG: patatin-like phospholipase family protein [Dehalococcoidales bacterium]|nr:patatin-like phospholipase family protein [Dehalococcoidales bacterium]
MRKKVGLALGSGAAKGMAHIGVLEVFQKEGIPIDMIAGTSIGAAIGVIYARTQDATNLKMRILELNSRKLAMLIDPALPKNGFLKGRKIKDLLASFLDGGTKFSDLDIPFACVAADIDTGEEVVFDRGPVLEAVRASISIPAVFTVAKCRGRNLVDGQLVNPVPVNVVRRMGADFIIAVNVLPDLQSRLETVTEEPRGKRREPTLMHVMMQSMYITTYKLAQTSMEGADIVIEPPVAGIGSGDFQRAEECILQGELAAEDAIPAIRRRLGM